MAIDRIYFTDTAVKAGIKLPENEDISICNAFPNPFANKTTIQYRLQNEGQVSLNVYDLNGKMVSQLLNANQEAGIHEVTFDASRLYNGIYVYRLKSADGVNTGRLILEK